MDSGNDTPIPAAGLVLSDRAAAGEYEDRSGPVLRRFLDEWRLAVAEVSVIPDHPQRLTERLDAWDRAGVRLALCSGGTGLGPRDRTPDTLRAWAQFEVPGIGEWMRAESARFTPTAWLSRGGAWVRHDLLVAALPGSPKALEQILPGLGPLLLHALRMLDGQGH